MPPASKGEGRVRLHREHAEVTRRTRPTGRVRVSTVTGTRDELIDELLTNENAEIERVPIRQLVDVAPEIREEGDTIIIPLVEEVVVVERRLMLKEEIRIRRVKTTERHQETVTLREQDVVVTREPVEPVPAGEAIAGTRKAGSGSNKRR